MAKYGVGVPEVKYRVSVFRSLQRCAERSATDFVKDVGTVCISSNQSAAAVAEDHGQALDGFTFVELVVVAEGQPIEIKGVDSVSLRVQQGQRV